MLVGDFYVPLLLYFLSILIYLLDLVWVLNFFLFDFVRLVLNNLNVLILIDYLFLFFLRLFNFLSSGANMIGLALVFINFGNLIDILVCLGLGDGSCVQNVHVLLDFSQKEASVLKIEISDVRTHLSECLFCLLDQYKILIFGFWVF